MMVKVVRKHPVSIRWNHWINFPLMCVMIWSGLMISWSSEAYFIKAEWLEKLGLGSQLGFGLSWHLNFAFIFVVNGILYTLFLLATGHWRYLTPGSFREILRVVLHDMKIDKRPLPERPKYNAAQSATYLAVLFMGIGITLTGFAIYKPVQLNWLTALCGGYPAARLEHFSIMILFIAFFLVHIAQVIRAGWPNFVSMLSGLERKEDVVKEKS